MENQFFEEDFRFDQYIRERLLEISDEGERRALKDVMQKTLIPFYEHVEGKYRDLSERLFMTTEMASAKPLLITGIEKRDKVDLTEDAMYPMNYADLNGVVVDAQEMMENVSAGKPYVIFRVFVEGNADLIRRIEKERRIFRGMIFTEDGEYHAEVRMVPNHSYTDQIARLYPIFENNGIAWTTVNMPYLNKFYDVEVLRTQCPEDENILKFQVDFEDYAKFVRFDLIPTWNVRFLTEKTGAYPDLAVDRVHYEHCIYRSHFKENRQYLVADAEVRLWDVFMQDGDLHVTCNDQNPRNWKLMELNDVALQRSNAYPVFHNGTAGVGRKGGCIHTKAEVKRFVDELGCKELYLLDLEILKPDAVQEWKTYSMDAFLEDEIRVGENREILRLKFRATDPGNYLNYDVMSYLVSRLQWEIPEFQCIGELE